MFYRILIICFILVAPGILFASPGGPDRDQHPYVGMLVELEGGQIDPYGHITLISEERAIIANHCAQRGQDITFTLDNPVLFPEVDLHTGTVLLGGWDFDDFDVDVALVALHVPIELPRYAQLPSGPITHGPGVILDFVTYISVNRANLMVCGGLPSGKYLQNEPGNVNFDRNIIRTPTVRPRRNLYIDPTKHVATANITCFGSSGSPVFLKGTNIIAGVCSWGGYRCLGGGDSIFARTDNELALGILNETVQPPTIYPHFIEGWGTSGSLSFPATIVAGAEYSASVIGLVPGVESFGTVVGINWQECEENIAIFPVSLTPGFRYFVAELFDEYTSGNDDLDLYLIWTVDGEPYWFFASYKPASDEMVEFSEEDLAGFAGLVDDPYNFEIWVHGFFTEYGTSDFTLFTWELEDEDKLNMTVSSVTAEPMNPFVDIYVDWSGLDPGEKKYFGIIDHAIDDVPEPKEKSTLIQIHIPPAT